MAERVIRVMLDFSSGSGKACRIWTSVNTFTVRSISEFLDQVRRKLSLECSSLKVELFVKDCLLPEDETTAILRDDDIVNVRVSPRDAPIAAASGSPSSAFIFDQSRRPSAEENHVSNSVDITTQCSSIFNNSKWDVKERINEDNVQFENKSKRKKRKRSDQADQKVALDLSFCSQDKSAASLEDSKSNELPRKKRKRSKRDKEAHCDEDIQGNASTGDKETLGLENQSLKDLEDSSIPLKRKKEKILSEDSKNDVSNIDTTPKSLQTSTPLINADEEAPATEKKRRRRHRKKHKKNKNDATSPFTEPVHQPEVSKPAPAINNIPQSTCNKRIIFDDDGNASVMEQTRPSSTSLSEEQKPSAKKVDLNCDASCSALSSNSKPDIPNNITNTISPKPSNPPNSLQKRTTRNFKNKMMNDVLSNYSSIFTCPESRDSLKEESEPAKPSNNVNYDTFPLLSGPPRIGDTIVYKILELSENYTPEVSSYKKGKVTHYDSNTNLVRIEYETAEVKKPREGKFELTEESDEVEVVKSVEINWINLLEPRLLPNS